MSSRRRKALGAGGLALALALSGVAAGTAAHAAAPTAGTYEGTSTAYSDATVSFEIDANGRMTNFETTSYCTDGFFVNVVTWAGMPPTTVQAGVPFDFDWDLADGSGFGSYYELAGVISTDGTASGTGRAGFLPYGVCGGMNFEWSATLVDAPAPAPVEVVAEVPVRDGNTVTIPVVDGVTYEDASGSPLVGSVTLAEGQVLTVVAVADDGYVLVEGDHQWTFEYEDLTPAPVEVVAEVPVRDGNTVTIPVVDGVTYEDASGSPLVGSVTLAEGQVLTVVAVADDGYVLVEGDHQWTFEYEDLTPAPVEVVAEVPVRDGNTVTIPVVDGVTYEDADGLELSGSVTLGEGETLTVTAVADDGYVLVEGDHQWTFEYEDLTPAPVEVVAEVPVRDGNTVTIPVVDGVTYEDADGLELSGSVTLGEGETLTVTAVADDGYVLVEGGHQWTFEYEDLTPAPETIPAVTPSEDDLDAAREGAITAPDEAQAGDTITIAIEGADEGDEVGVWLFSTSEYLGAHTVDVDGNVTVTIPADTAIGDHRIAVWSGNDESLIGWDVITIVTDDEDDDNGSGGDDGNGNGTGGDNGDGNGDGTGSGDDKGDGTGSDDSGDGNGSGAGTDGDASDAGNQGDPSGNDGDLATTGGGGAGYAGLVGLLLLVSGAGLLMLRRRARA